MSGPSFRIVIPARYGATRLPAKPLADVAGAPLVVRVWERAQESGAVEVVVAADDERICEAVLKAGGEAQLTSTDHTSGTDRLAEVCEARGWDDRDIVVNLQGDEPLVPPSIPSTLASALANYRRPGIATAATQIVDPAMLFNPNVVKTVLDGESFATYFSRAPIPWARDAFAEGRPRALPSGVPFLRHIGLYAYRVATLRAVAAAERAPLEIAESLEQLRAMALGIGIHVTLLDEAPPHGVDTPEDLERVRALFGERS